MRFDRHDITHDVFVNSDLDASHRTENQKYFERVRFRCFVGHQKRAYISLLSRCAVM